MTTQKSALRGTKGFTLVELIVTITLMTILLGIGVFALPSFVRHARFKKQNEIAKTVFVAAQTQLTQDKADGTAAALTQACAESALRLNDGAAMRYALVDSAGETVTAASVWQHAVTQAGGVQTIDAARLGTLYSLTGTAADYAWYCEYEAGRITDAAAIRAHQGIIALYGLFSDYLYDKSVLDGTVCVEFDPAEGLAYAVLYCDRASAGFTYTPGAEPAKTDITSRTEAARSPQMLGYYGVDTLSKAPHIESSRPVIRTAALHNEETLYLTWKLDAVSAGLTSQLKYCVEICDDATQNCVLRLHLNQQGLTGSDVLKAQDAGSPLTISARVERAKTNSADAAFEDLGTRTFAAWVDADGQVHLVLDAADLAATETEYDLAVQAQASAAGFAAAGADALMNTYSLHRFLLEQLGTGDIYCRVYGEATGIYQQTAARATNTENMYFASFAQAASGGKTQITCTLQNARHLYNIRYAESSESWLPAANSTVQYTAAADMAWNGAEGLVAGGSVYSAQQVCTGAVAFPGISALRTDGTFTSASARKPAVISGLTLSSKADRDALVPNSYDKDYDASGDAWPATATGLFLYNYGTIRAVTLGDVAVSGYRNVGSFCGVNFGTLADLRVDGGEVYGVDDVGGVFGYQDATSAQRSGGKNKTYTLTLSHLVNAAQVVGRQYVGGITGRLTAQAYKGNKGNGIGNSWSVAYTLKDCENYGIVRGDWNTAETAAAAQALYADYGADEPSYIGGILGWCSTQPLTITKNKKTYTLSASAALQNCLSAPTMTQKAADALLAQIAAAQPTDGAAQYLRGTYVGGIVGYNDGGTLTGCTLRQNGTQQTYVIGGRYVGGIAGWSEGDLAGGGLETGGNVLGRSCVGGIVGCTQNTKKTGLTVSGWTVRGLTLATVSFAGGIAGDNEGTITDCTVASTYNAAAQKLLQACGRSAVYAGGLAGCSTGALKNCTVVCAVVEGSRFVGGLCGALTADASAAVTNCTAQSGYLYGGDFVGGCIGLNLNTALLQNAADSLSASPNVVEGRYYVGGCFGACVVAPGAAAALTLPVDCKNNLGTITATAYAGGFAGLCAAVSSGTDLSLPLLAADASGSAITALTAVTDAAQTAGLADRVFAGRGAAGFVLTLTGQKDAQGTVQAAHFAAIRAQLYAGGILGYAPEGTRLVLQQLVSASPVAASGFVQSRELGAADGNLYSYAGGILGRVSGTAVIAGCSLADTGTVSSAGSFTGAFAEVNCGRILGCSAASLSAAADNLGGIVGLNKAAGTAAYPCTYQNTVYAELGVADCTVPAGAVLSGRSNVGGVAAQNYGLIRDTALEGASLAFTGSCCGGVAGVNGSTGGYTGEIRFTAARTLRAVLSGTGSYAGAIAGYSGAGTGPASAQTGTPAAVTLNGKLTLAQGSRVAAGEAAGGFFGMLVSSTAVTGLENRAAVSAEAGTAGGIAALGGSSFDGCSSYGSVEVKKANAAGLALAGGIVADNTGTLRHCLGAGTVRTGAGACGGIAGRSSGTILRCQAGTADGDLTLTGDTWTGGIAGYNGGTITDCCASRLTLNNQSTSTGSFLGGIAGENAGAITGCLAGASYAAPAQLAEGMAMTSAAGTQGSGVTIVSLAAGVCAGGIAGRSDAGASITGTADCRTAAHCTAFAALRFVSAQSLDYFGNLGGIAGQNLGTVRSCSFSGSVQGTANDPRHSPAYDPNTETEAAGTVLCGYGGIAGINGAADRSTAALIGSCYVFDASVTGIGNSDNIVNVGGAAGVNGRGCTIDGIDYGSDTTGVSLAVSQNGKTFALADGTAAASYTAGGSVLVQASDYGHVGGAAGYNLGAIRSICAVSGETRTTAADARHSPASAVLVATRYGHVGGIAGYNRVSGSVSDASTGSAWVVTALNSAQDNGCGGILGYNVSENDLEYCRNWACVIKTSSASNGVGGMIGRCEPAGGGFAVNSCCNYGNISGWGRVAGMVGVVKYRGITVQSCVNFGWIYIASTDTTETGGAGIVGQYYGSSVSGDYLNLYDCANHGTVGVSASTASAGGIFAFCGSSTARFRLCGCVNTGLIRGRAASSAGILGDCRNAGSGSLIAYCANYGYADAAGSAMQCGIAPAGGNSGNISLLHCVGAASVPYPITASNSGSPVSSCYYFSPDSTAPAGTADDYFAVRSIQWKGSGVSGSDYSQMIDAKTDSRSDQAGATYYCQYAGNVSQSSSGIGTGKTSTITYAFNRAISLSEVTVWWTRSDADAFDSWWNGYDGTYDASSAYYTAMTRRFSYTIETSQDGTAWTPFAAVAEDGAALDPEAGVTSAGTAVSAQYVRLSLQAANADAALQEIEFGGTLTMSDGTACAYSSHEGFLSGDANYAGAVALYRSATGSTGSGGISRIEAASASVQTGSGKGTLLYVSRLGAAYRAATAAGTAVFTNLTVDPRLLNASLHPSDSLTSSADLPTMRNAQGQALTANRRYALEQTLQPQLIEQLGGTAAGTAAGLRLTDQGGSYLASWANTTADYFVVQADFIDAAGNTLSTSQTTTYVSSLSILTAGHAGETLRVTVTPYLLRGGTAGTAGTQSAQLHAMLPTPVVRLELVRASGLTGDYRYRAVLENAADYTAFAAAQGISASDITITLTSSGNGSPSKFTFTAADGMSQTLYNATSAGNRYLSAQASASGCDLSSQQTRESQALTNSALTGSSKLASITFAGSGYGFAGQTQDSLSYRIGMTGSGIVLYLRSELMATDQNLGVSVALSSSLLRTSTVTQNVLTTSLSSLPPDLLDASRYTGMYVRSYPYMMSNSMVTMGHSISLGTALTAEQLRTLRVTDDGRIGTAADGLLLYDASAQTDAASSGCSYTARLRSGYVLEYAGADTYTLYYNILLAGVTAPAAGASGMTNQVQYYGISADSLRLQPAPQLALTQNETALTVSWDKVSTESDYSYTVTGTLPDAAGTQVQLLQGTFSGAELAALWNEQDGLYEWKLTDTASWTYSTITVALTRNAQLSGGSVVRHACAASQSIAFRHALTTPSGQLTLQLAAQADGTRQKDELRYDISWAGLGSAAEQAALDHYELTLTADGLPALVLSTASGSGAVSLADQNLNAYNGKTVSFTLRAVAKAGSDYYSSAASSAFTYGMPTRLTQPQSSALSVSWSENGTANPANVSLDTFENGGFTIRMNTASATIDGVTGAYEAQLLLCSSASAQTGTVLTTAAMTGDFRSGSYVLSQAALSSWSGAYSARWLGVRVRAVSASRISSEWSALAVTALPTVTLDAPEITAAQTAHTASVTLGGGSYTLDTVQQQLSFAAARCSAGYTLLLQDASGTVSRVNVTSADGWESWQVGYSAGTAGGGFAAETVLTADSAGVYALPYAQTLTDAQDASVQLTLAGTLQITSAHDGTAAVTLVLPDAAQATLDGDTALQANAAYTASLTVRTQAPQNYAAPQDAVWSR